MKETSNAPHPQGFLQQSLPPCVVVHSLEHATTALAPGRPVTLLSARGAALYAGAGWWRQLVAQARARHPHTHCHDVLDCARAPGLALAALRLGQTGLLLDATSPGYARVAALAAAKYGVRLLSQRPPSLDLAGHGALRLLPAVLAGSKDI